MGNLRNNKRHIRILMVRTLILALFASMPVLLSAVVAPTIDTIAGIPVKAVGTTYASSTGTIAFVGRADQTAFIRLYEGATEVGASVVDASGVWTISRAGIWEGTRSYRAYSITYPTLVQQTATATVCFDVTLPGAGAVTDNVAGNNDPDYLYTVDSKIYFGFTVSDALSGLEAVEIQIASEPTFASPIFQGFIATSSPYCFANAQPNINYCARIRSFDRAGNVSAWGAASDGMTRIEQESLIPPSVPSLVSIAGKPTQYGTTLYFSSASVSVKGVANPQNVVAIYRDGLHVGTCIADSMGDFDGTIAVALSTHTIQVRAVNNVGISPLSLAQTVFRETTAPVVSRRLLTSNGEDFSWANFLTTRVGSYSLEVIEFDVTDSGGSQLDLSNSFAQFTEIDDFGTVLPAVGTYTNPVAASLVAQNARTFRLVPTVPWNLSLKSLSRYRLSWTMRDKAGNSVTGWRDYAIDNVRCSEAAGVPAGPPQCNVKEFYLYNYAVYGGGALNPADMVRMKWDSMSGAFVINVASSPGSLVSSSTGKLLFNNIGIYGNVYTAEPSWPPVQAGHDTLCSYLYLGQYSTWINSGPDALGKTNYFRMSYGILPNGTHTALLTMEDNAYNHDSFPVQIGVGVASPAPPVPVSVRFFNASTPAVEYPCYTIGDLVGSSTSWYDEYRFIITNTTAGLLIQVKVASQTATQTVDVNQWGTILSSAVVSPGQTIATLTVAFGVATPGSQYLRIRSYMNGFYSPSLPFDNGYYYWLKYDNAVPVVQSVLPAPGQYFRSSTFPTQFSVLGYDLHTTGWYSYLGLGSTTINLYDRFNAVVPGTRTKTYNPNSSLYELVFAGTVIPSVEGKYTLNAFLADASCAAPRVTTASYTFYLDLTPPAVTITPADGSVVTSLATFSCSITDPLLADGNSGSGVRMEGATVKWLRTLADAVPPLPTSFVGVVAGGDATDQTGSILSIGSDVYLCPLTATGALTTTLIPGTLTDNTGGSITVSAAGLNTSLTYRAFYQVPVFVSNTGAGVIQVTPTSPVTAWGTYALFVTPVDLVGNVGSTKTSLVTVNLPTGAFSIMASDTILYAGLTPPHQTTYVSTPISYGLGGPIASGTLVTVRVEVGSLTPADANGNAGDWHQVPADVDGKISFMLLASGTITGVPNVRAIIGGLLASDPVLEIKAVPAFSVAPNTLSLDITSGDPSPICTITAGPVGEVGTPVPDGTILSGVSTLGTIPTLDIDPIATGTQITLSGGSGAFEVSSGNAGTATISCEVGGVTIKTAIVFVDKHPPNAPGQASAGEALSVTGDLPLFWAISSDPGGSGIAEYGVEQSLDGGAWTFLASTTVASLAVTGLTNGSYSYRVCAVDGAGNGGAFGPPSDNIDVIIPPFVADPNPPSDVTVSVIASYSGSATSLGASWTASVATTSFIHHYEMAIGTTPGGSEALGWKNVALALSYTATALNLLHGQTYYVSVKAVNGGNLSSISTSPGVTVDLLAPPEPVMNIEPAYTSSTVNLVSCLPVLDGLSEGVEYLFVGPISLASPPIVDFSGWTATPAFEFASLTHAQTYWFQGQTRDAVGNISKWSPAVFSRQDKNPPTAASYTDAVLGDNTDPNHVWTRDTTAAFRPISLTDDLSGVGNVYVEVATDPLFLSDFIFSGWVGVTGYKSATGGTHTETIYTRAQFWDVASNPSSWTVTDGITIDLVDPVASATTDERPENNHRDPEVSSSPQIMFGFTHSDSGSGVEQVRVQVSSGSSFATPVIDTWVVGTPTQYLFSSGMDGGIYYARIQARDRSQRLSPWGSMSNGLRIDMRGPDGSLQLFPFPWGSSTTLLASISASDLSLIGPQMDLSIDGGAFSSVPFASSMPVGLIAPVSEGIHTIRVRPYDTLGNVSTFTATTGCDFSPPLTPGVSDDGDFSPYPDKLNVSWTAFDAYSGVAYSLVSIGTTPFGAELASETNVGNVTNKMFTGLVLDFTASTSYYFTVRVVDNVGHVSASATSDGIRVDVYPPPVPLMNPEPQYTSSTVNLVGCDVVVDPLSGGVNYQFQRATNASFTLGLALSPWLGAPAHTFSLLSGGTTYYYRVCAKDAVGNISSWSAAVWSTQDTVLPTITSFTDNVPANADPDHVWTRDFAVNFETVNATDTLSGLDNIFVDIAATPLFAPILWSGGIGASGTMSFDATGLATSGQTLYARARARDVAGNLGVWSTTDGITIDLAPPVPGATTDNLPENLPNGSVSSSSTIVFGFTPSDAVSGLSGVHIQIASDSAFTQIVADEWLAATSTKYMYTGGQDGVIYYAHVAATDRAGWTSAWGTRSDGIRIDVSSPTGTISMPQWCNTPAVTITLMATDSSGVPLVEMSYDGAASVSEAFAATKIWNPGALDGTEHGVRVRFIDGVGYISDISAASTTFDFSVPVVSSVVDDGEYSPWLDRLHVSWTATDSISGLGQAWCRVGTAPGLDNIASDTDVGLVGSYSFHPLVLDITGAVQYFFTLKVIDNAGNISATVSTDGIRGGDPTPPLPVTVTDDGDYTASTTTLHATWSASDDLDSGIKEYEFGAGTTPGATNIVGWTNVAFANEHTATGLSLSHGQTCYLSVRISNNGGTSTVCLGDGITVDTVEPTSPTLTPEPAYSSGTSNIVSCPVATDALSGGVAYLFERAEDAGFTTGTANSGWISTPSFEFPGLTHGQGYYFRVRARDAVKNETTPSASENSMQDSSIPVVTGYTDAVAGNNDPDATWSQDTTISFSPDSAPTDTVSGMKDVYVEIATDSGFSSLLPGSGWLGNVTGEKTVVVAVADGDVIYARAKFEDVAGNQTGWFTTNGIRLDLSDPVADATTDNVLDNDDPHQGISRDGNLYFGFSHSDAISGVVDVRVQIATDSGFTAIVFDDWLGGVAAPPHLYSSGLDGMTYYARIQVKDAAGRTSSGTFGLPSDGIVVDMSGPVPSGPPFLINGGDSTTATTTVFLTLCITDPSGVAVASITNDTISWTQWNAPGLDPVQHFWLLDGSTTGSKTVTVCFKDGVGNVSPFYTQTISFFPQNQSFYSTRDQRHYPVDTYEEYLGQNKYGTPRSVASEPAGGRSLRLIKP